jgi:hypothetical protein
MRGSMRGVAAAIVMASCAAASAAQGTAPAAAAEPKKPSVEIRIDSGPLTSCHFLLKNWQGGGDKPIAGQGADLASEAGAYARAKENIKDPGVWKWFEDLVVAGPDPDAVREGAKSLPPAFNSPSNRTAVDMLVEALASAYPKFLSGYWTEQSAALNRLLIPARRRFARPSERIEQVLMEKMAFEPVGAPITILMVLRAGPVSSWGKTAAGYYSVVGAYLQSVDTFIETSVHEATHLIDAVQPAGGSWMLKEVRRALPKEAPAESIDAFIHGLVAYNAGELVTRYMDNTYKPVGLRGPNSREEFAPFIPAYEGAWGAWLDGTKSRQETIGKLVEGFKAALAKKPTAPAKKG